MSQMIDVDWEELPKKAYRMQNSLEKISNRINYLYSDVLYKIGDDWKSKDNYEYLNNLSDYLDDLKQFYDSMEKYIAFLHVAHEEYEDMLRNGVIEATSFRWEE